MEQQLIESQEREFESLYIWDNALKIGFPVTQNIKAIDITKLTEDERKVLAVGNEEQISQLVAARATTLAYQLKLSVKILGIVLQEIYHDSTPEVQEQVSSKVKKVLEEIQNGAFDDE